MQGAAYAILYPMKGGLHTKLTGGFTIVETLIVLAVTGVIFLSAATLISGKEAKTEFIQSLQSIVTQLQQTISEVQTGFYSNTGNFSCSAAAGGPLTFTTGGSVTAEGANKGCVFIGKAVYFPLVTNTTLIQPVYVHTIVGLQRDGSGNEVQTLAAAKAVVLEKGVSPGPYQSVPNEYVTSNLKYGLQPVSIKQDSTSLLGIAFVSGLGQYDSTNSQLLSGSQQVNLLPIPGTLSSDSKADAGAMDDYFQTVAKQAGDPLSPYNPTDGISICFRSGTTGQSGLVTISNGESKLVVTSVVKSSVDCT